MEDSFWVMAISYQKTLLSPSGKAASRSSIRYERGARPHRISMTRIILLILFFDQPSWFSRRYGDVIEMYFYKNAVLFFLFVGALPMMAQTPPPLSPAQVLAYDSRRNQDERTYLSNLLVTVGGTVAGAGLLMQEDATRRSSLSLGITYLALGTLNSLYRTSVETAYAQYMADPENNDPKKTLEKLQVEARLTRYVLGGSVMGLGLLSLPRGDLTDSEYNDLMLYWRAAMFGIGLAAVVFPSSTEVRYQEAIAEVTGFRFFVEPTVHGGLAVGLRH